MMNFNEAGKFKKDLKRLSKKYKSLPGDLSEFKKVVSHDPIGAGRHFAILASQNEITIIKARLFCRYLKGSSLRIIYGVNKQAQTIVFIELYFKGDKPNEDQNRIKEFLTNKL